MSGARQRAHGHGLLAIWHALPGDPGGGLMFLWGDPTETNLVDLSWLGGEKTV